MPNPFQATRYPPSSPGATPCRPKVEVTAWTAEDEVMGLRHRHQPIWGVQFHPESILTESGRQILPIS